jgi:hypothetical protein
MSKGEINESIPPAYTQLIGEQMIRHIETTRQTNHKLRRWA